VKSGVLGISKQIGYFVHNGMKLAVKRELDNDNAIK
jgi:hypothetical protein